MFKLEEGKVESVTWLFDSDSYYLHVVVIIHMFLYKKDWKYLPSLELD